MNRRVKRTLCTGLAALMLAGCMTGTTVYAETAKEKVDRLEAALKQEKASLEKLQKDKKNALWCVYLQYIFDIELETHLFYLRKEL